MCNSRIVATFQHEGVKETDFSDQKHNVGVLGRRQEVGREGEREEAKGKGKDSLEGYSAVELCPWVCIMWSFRLYHSCSSVLRLHGRRGGGVIDCTNQKSGRTGPKQCLLAWTGP